MKKAVLFVSHGSTSAQAVDEAHCTTQSLKQKIPLVEAAFLEINQPSIAEGIDRCVEQGASEIVVLLNFLNSGKHVLEDIPQIIKDAKKKHPQISIKVSEPVGQHPQIENLFIDLIDKAV